MMDKKSDPETKKYAAIREGITEVIAIPVYIAIPAILGKIIDKSKSFKDLHAQKLAKGNAKFLGVCASTLIIPAVCNVIQPPIMKAYKKSQEAKNTKIGTEVNPVKTAQAQTTFKGRINYGMKVGA
jgi:hypothetical protein